MSEWSRIEAATLEDKSRTLLRILYLCCGHCGSWAPSKTVFWHFEGFERARQRGALNLCPQCHRSNRSNEQKYRAFWEDGAYQEGH